MVDFNNIDDLSDRELKWAYWWVHHKQQVKAGVLLTVIISLVALYGYNGWLLFKYLSTTPQHNQVLAELSRPFIDYTKIRRLQSPRQLSVGEVSVINSGEDSVDIVVLVENLNNKWWLKEVEYRFVIGGEATPTSFASIMPRQKLYLYYFNFDKDKYKDGTVRLEIIRQKWRRIRGDKLIEISRFDFDSLLRVENVKFVPAEGERASVVQFDLVNESPYNFWQVEAQVVARQGKKIKGFYVTGIREVDAGARLPIIINWHQKLPPFVVPEVLVVADYLSTDNIRSYPDINNNLGL